MMFAGDYSVFEKTSRERLRNQLSKIEAQDKHRKHVQVRDTMCNHHLARIVHMAHSSCADPLVSRSFVKQPRGNCCAWAGQPLKLNHGLSAACAPQAFIDKFRYNAKRASMVQSRIKALERLEELEAVEQDPEYVFKCESQRVRLVELSADLRTCWKACVCVSAVLRHIPSLCLLAVVRT